MKKKVLFLLALVAVIGFTFSACGGGNSGWPPSNVRNNYGIGGLNQPPGSNFEWTIVSFSGAINIAFRPANNTLSVLDSWFTSNGWPKLMETSGMVSWKKGAQTAMYGIPEEGGLVSLGITAP